MKCRWSILFVMFICMFFRLQSQSHTATPKSVDINNNCKGYYEFLPQGYGDTQNVNKRYPVLIDIQGTGSEGDGSATDLKKLLKYGAAYYITEGKFSPQFSYRDNSYSFIVISVQFQERGNGMDIVDVIDFLWNRYRIDTGRIYLSGYSGGGEPVWRYPCLGVNHSGTIAALVAVAGVNTNRSYTGIDHIVSSALPVWALHSKDDEVSMTPVENSENFVEKINELEPPVPATFTMLTGSHKDTWLKVYDPSIRYSLNGENVNIYEWMLRYERVFTVLPVSLISYTVSIQNQETVAIRWQTEKEENSHSFVIERSLNGDRFEKIASLPSRSNDGNGEGASYIWHDQSPVHGKSWYRLSQIDNNGKIHYFDTKEVAINQGGEVVKIFPTLVKDNTIRLSFKSVRRHTSQIRVLDMNGAVLHQSNIPTTAGQTVLISIDKWSQGLHVVEITLGDGNIETFKVMKI